MNAHQRRKARRLPHPSFAAWGRCPTCRAPAGAPCVLPWGVQQRRPFSETRPVLVHTGRSANRSAFPGLWPAPPHRPDAFKLPELRGTFAAPVITDHAGP